MRPASACRSIAAACLVVALAPAVASAANQVLLIGKRPADAAALTRLWTRLQTRFGFTDVRIATAASSQEVGKSVRGFLGRPGSAGDLRLVWIASAPDGPAAVCPAWSEDYVRPQVPTILVAPPCIKFLVQAPSTYEHLSAAAAPAPGAPGVVFVSTPNTNEGAVELLAALNESAAAASTDASARALVTALVCAGKDKLAVDFSPSSSAWHIVPPLCPDRAARAPAAEPSPAGAPAASDVPAPPPARPDNLADAGAPEVAAAPVTPVTQAPLAEPEAPSFVAPVDGTVVADFGAQAGGKPNNKGIDFEALPGSAVKAAEAGQVVYVGDLPNYGKVIAIKHGNDWATVYGHASDIDVAKGQTVAKGQDIAKVDPTTHRLHFEVRRRGQPVNPHPMMASARP